jgi:predicted N-acetyltransferase YhbS
VLGAVYAWYMVMSFGRGDLKCHGLPTEADQHMVHNLARMLAFQEPAARVEIPNTVLVSEIDNNIVGVIGVDKRDAHTADLKLLYVSGGFRRSGIGHSLAVAAIDTLGLRA